MEYGQVEMDNCLAQNAIRLVPLGRKNYLFVGLHEDARHAAILYPLLATAKLNNIEIFAWFGNDPDHIADHRHKSLATLLPQN